MVLSLFSIWLMSRWLTLTYTYISKNTLHLFPLISLLIGARPQDWTSRPADPSRHQPLRPLARLPLLGWRHRAAWLGYDPRPKAASAATKLDANTSIFFGLSFRSRWWVSPPMGKPEIKITIKLFVSLSNLSLPSFYPTIYSISSLNSKRRWRNSRTYQIEQVVLLFSLIAAAIGSTATTQPLLLPLSSLLSNLSLFQRIQLRHWNLVLKTR